VLLSGERIEIGERIRDIVEDRDGRLILWTERAYVAPTSGAIVVVEPVIENGGLAKVSMAAR